MPESFSTRASDPYAALVSRVSAALNALAPGQATRADQTDFGEADFADLATMFSDTAPGRILDVDGGGASALLLALAFPGARVIAIDPDRAIDLPAAEGNQGRMSWTALSLAQAAATRLGAGERIRFAPGAFAAAPRASGGVRAVGPDTCASEPDFDLILLDSDGDAETRLADLRLAASALAPNGVIAVRRVAGGDGALVRAGIFEFLRYNPAFHFMYAPLAQASGAMGFLRHRSAGWFPGFESPRPARAEDVSNEVREGLAGQVSLMLGDRPVLEVAVGAPVLGPGFRQRGGANRTLRLTATDWTARFFDPLIDQILSALDHAPGSVLFSSDLLDFASDEFITRLFARLADRATPVLFAVTPPGEAGVAGPASRPAARLIDLAAGQGLSAYGPAGLEFEAARHAGANAAEAADNSRYLSLLLFAGQSSWRDAAGRSLTGVAPVAAAQHEQIELQRIQAHAALRARIAEQETARSEAERRESDLADRLDASLRAADVARQSHERALAAHAEAQAQLRGELREQTELGRTLQTSLAEAEAALLAAQQRQRETEADFAARLEGAEAALFAHRDRFQRDLSEITDRLSEANQREAAADAALADLRAELDARSAALSESRTRIGALTTERINLEGEIEDLKSAAAQAQSELQTRRNSEAALQAERDSLSRQLLQTRNRIDELSALRAAKAQEAERLTQHLNAANARVVTMQAEREDAARAIESEVADLHSRLSTASSQVVANALREMDAQQRLDGIDAHLLLAQEAVDRFRSDPASFRADALTYPPGPETESGEADLVNTVKALHGRAADVSRDIAKVLEEAAMQPPAPTPGTVIEARLAAAETSHREAMEKQREDFATRIADAESARASVSAYEASAASIDTLLGRIEQHLPKPALAPGQPVEGASGDPLAGTRVRLEHVLHVLEAGAARAAAVPPSLPSSPPSEPATTRPEPAPARPAPTITPADLAVNQPRTWLKTPGPTPPPPRTFLERTDDWLRAYPETFRLTRLMHDLRDRFEPLGLKPRIFDAAYYLSQGPIAPHTDPLTHYLLVGEKAGRRPIPGFDPVWYRARAHDAAASKTSLLRHFFRQGADDGIAPSEELADLAGLADAAGMSPLEYFMRWKPAQDGGDKPSVNAE
ncbi:MAG: hypothetical protein GC155_12120 [Alphaproteobacteria bacterium]|nr:hypothetical protein [Alphaproteobacteria bacterium]